MTLLMPTRERLALARLYVCTDARRGPDDLHAFVEDVIRGGVDLVQLRDKALSTREAVETLRGLRRVVAQRPTGLLVANDDPAVAEAALTDVVHLGQGDAAPREARRRLPHTLIGRSTHSVEQARAALADDDVDYFCVGPVWATPTKPDYEPVGLELVRWAAEHAPVGRAKPWFAIGGIDTETIEDVLAAGARRVVVVRALTEAENPHAAALALDAALARAWEADR